MTDDSLVELSRRAELFGLGERLPELQRLKQESATKHGERILDWSELWPEAFCVKAAGFDSPGLPPSVPRAVPKTLADAVTICVTSYLRPESLATCLASIARFYPALKVDVDDTGGNVSASRNRLIARCETPYYLLIEEDMEFTPRTRIEPLLDVVAHDDQILGCGGFLVEHSRTPWHHDWWEFRGGLEMVCSRRPMRVSPAGVPYLPCQAIQNFAVFRTRESREWPWDEELPLHEHTLWYYSFRRQWLVGYTLESEIIHTSARPNEAYNKMRARSRDFQPLVERKLGLRVRSPEREQIPDSKPCIVLLGVGHSNTTIGVRQLDKLGWELGDADQEYAESVSVRDCNQRIIAGKPPTRSELDAVLSVLPKPWVIKDPRFCRTLGQWLPSLASYAPLLVWIQKDLQTVAASWARREEGSPESVARLFAAASQAFELYPWAKVVLRAEDIAEAVAIFDVDRSRGLRSEKAPSWS